MGGALSLKKVLQKEFLSTLGGNSRLAHKDRRRSAAPQAQDALRGVVVAGMHRRASQRSAEMQSLAAFGSPKGGAHARGGRFSPAHARKGGKAAKAGKGGKAAKAAKATMRGLTKHGGRESLAQLQRGQQGQSTRWSALAKKARRYPAATPPLPP